MASLTSHSKHISYLHKLTVVSQCWLKPNVCPKLLSLLELTHRADSLRWSPSGRTSSRNRNSPSSPMISLRAKLIKWTRILNKSDRCEHSYMTSQSKPPRKSKASKKPMLNFDSSVINESRLNSNTDTMTTRSKTVFINIRIKLIVFVLDGPLF